MSKLTNEQRGVRRALRGCFQEGVGDFASDRGLDPIGYTGIGNGPRYAAERRLGFWAALLLVIKFDLMPCALGGSR